MDRRAFLEWIATLIGLGVAERPARAHTAGIVALQASDNPWDRVGLALHLENLGSAS